MSEPTKRSFSVTFACMGAVGRFPKAPGTAGSAVAAVLAPLIFIPLPLVGKLLVLGILFWLGALAADGTEKELGQKDPGCVIIDELVGQWIAFLPFATTKAWVLLVGFVLFRLFDIAKPWPIRRSETWLPGGYGVMIDDAIGGVFALLSLLIIGAIAGA